MKVEQMKVNHPEFSSVMKGHDGFPVVVFDRQHWNKPSDEAIELHRAKSLIVKHLGGIMFTGEWEIAGKSPVFKKSDIEKMQRATRLSLPGWKTRDSWNGVGCYSYSISIKQKGSKP